MIELDNLETNIKNYEQLVGASISDTNSNIDIYESLLAGAISLRSVNSEFNKIKPVIISMIEWLRRGDFYTAPASTKYHESYPTGLLEHSLNVYKNMMELLKLQPFNKINAGSAALVALTHDWCKIGKYESYVKNVKEDGVWVERSAYKCKENTVGLGHGPQSLVMVMQFCCNSATKLTFDEMAAIRWHMYTYDVTSYDIRDLNDCSNNIPLVKCLQFADQLATANF